MSMTGWREEEVAGTAVGLCSPPMSNSLYIMQRSCFPSGHTAKPTELEGVEAAEQHKIPRSRPRGRTVRQVPETGSESAVVRAATATFGGQRVEKKPRRKPVATPTAALKGMPSP